MSGVVVGHGKQKTGLADYPRQVERVFNRGGKRLVANNVNTGVEKRLCRRVVQVIRSDDRNRVDGIFSLRLRRGHFRETAISAVGRDVQIDRGRAARAGSEDNAAATNSNLSSSRAAMRCTAPMKPPGPPPTMPSRSRRFNFLPDFPSTVSSITVPALPVFPLSCSLADG